MSRRAVRLARRMCVKRILSESADFDVPEPLDVPPMTPEQEAEFAIEYQRDAIAEHASFHVRERR